MRTFATIISLSLIGCTTWSTATSMGPAREVGRRSKGMPSFATQSSQSMSGGFAAASTGNVLVAGYGAGSESMTRTRCIQDVDIAYEQDYEIQPTVINRSKDQIAGIALAAGGVLMILAGVQAENDPYSDASPTAGYIIGGGLVAGGAGLLLYSHMALPNGPKPEVARGVNRWVATQTVDAEGCVAPTVAQTPTTPSVIINNAPTIQSATDRLQTLDKLRASGTINDAEYKRKRAEIVNGI
jgi:hypothetical protein